MGLLRDVQLQTEYYLSGSYDVEPARGVPSVETLTRGKVAQLIDTAFAVFDLRIQLFVDRGRELESLARLHKCLLSTIARIARANRGHVRFADAERALVVFEPTPDDPKRVAVNATTTALHVVYAHTTVLRPAFKRLITFDLSAGVDQGEALAVKGGVRGDPDTTNVMWLGEAGSPYNVYCGESIYPCLTKELRHTSYTNLKGVTQDLPMWEATSLEFMMARHNAIKTRYQLKLY